MTTEYLVEHLPSGLWSSLTFTDGPVVQVVTDTSHITTMSLDSALTVIAYTTKHPDYRVEEV